MEEEIQLPKDVKANYENGELLIVGKLGEIRKKLKHPYVKIKTENSKIIFYSNLENRKAKKILKTFVSHAKNMIKGVQEGYTYKLKIIYTHFPMSVKVEGDKIIIENFIGERGKRIAKKIPGVDVKVEKQEITVSGIDLEAVSQTAANIERATRIVGKDRRVFQDGIYIIKRVK